MTQVTEDLGGQDRKLLSQIMELMPLDNLSIQEKQAFINGRGKSARWLSAQIKRYSKIILVEKAFRFDIRLVARGAFDNPNGEWKVTDIIPLPYRDTSEFDISRMHLRPLDCVLNGNEHPLGANVLQVFIENRDRIPKGWSRYSNGEKLCIIFSGTHLIDTYGDDCWLVLRDMDGQWLLDCFSWALINRANCDFKFVKATYQF